MNKHKFPMTALLALLLLVSITVSILSCRPLPQPDNQTSRSNRTHLDHDRPYSPRPWRAFCRNRTFLLRCSFTDCDEQCTGKSRHHRRQFRFRVWRNDCNDAVPAQHILSAPFRFCRSAAYILCRICTGLCNGQFQNHHYPGGNHHFQLSKRWDQYY